MEKNFTKVGGEVRFEFDTVGYVRGCAAGATGERGSEFFFFLKKRNPYGLGCIQNRGQKGIEKSPYGLGWNVKPRQKGTLWLRFLTEAKSYDLLASPQYASVPEPMQNIENNRCQRPFLHWCFSKKLCKGS